MKRMTRSEVTYHWRWVEGISSIYGAQAVIQLENSFILSRHIPHNNKQAIAVNTTSAGVVVVASA
jgi:hypothetical protein